MMTATGCAFKARFLGGKAQLVAISETGAGGEEKEEFWVLPFYPCLPPLLIASLPPWACVCWRERECVCVFVRVEALLEWVRQLTLLTRTGGAPVISAGKHRWIRTLSCFRAAICQTGTKRRESWLVVEWAGACWTGKCCSSRLRSARGGQCTFCQGNRWDQRPRTPDGKLSDTLATMRFMISTRYKREASEGASWVVEAPAELVRKKQQHVSLIKLQQLHGGTFIIVTGMRWY